MEKMRGKIYRMGPTGWVEIEEDILNLRGRNQWYPVNPKKQKPKKKISGAWYDMGVVTEKC